MRIGNYKPNLIGKMPIELKYNPMETLNEKLIIDPSVLSYIKGEEARQSFNTGLKLLTDYINELVPTNDLVHINVVKSSTTKAGEQVTLNSSQAQPDDRLALNYYKGTKLRNSRLIYAETYINEFNKNKRSPILTFIDESMRHKGKFIDIDV